MRVTYIQQHFAMQNEPGFVRAWEFCRRLAEDGHDVTVVRGAPESSDIRCDGVRVISVRAPYENEMRFRRRVVSFVQFAIGSTGEAVKTRPELVYASSTPLTVALPAILSAAIHRAKFVFEVRDLWPKVPVDLGLVSNPAVIWAAKLLERIAYSSASAVVALSPDMAEGVKEVSPNSAVTVVPNGCDMDLFDDIEVDRGIVERESGIPRGARHIVYAGGFGFMYDLPWCIDLAAALSERNVYFTFIGRGTESENLLALARERGIYREGMFPGRLPKIEVIRYLKGSDAALSALRDAPALEACSLNKVFDSMAASKPIFLNHGGWLASEVQSARAGWRVPRDIAAAADQIESVVRDSNVLVEAGRANRELGELKYARDDQYLKFRRAVLGID